MPRPGLPPTPASSTDIRGKNDHRLQTSDVFCTLPPPAITSTNQSTSSNASEKSDSSYHPVSPASPMGKSSASKQKKPAASKHEHLAANSNFSLPQPPTRSRKIIQMNPGSDHTNKANSASIPSAAAGKKTATTVGNSSTGASKKQPSATSVAGRKIARKTAHSLIERRRRSKMNEEFGVLKDMIPACHGQEMHKLAILQASIDYLRYLEKCIVDLKSANGKNQVLVAGAHEITSQRGTPQTPASPLVKRCELEQEEDDEDENGDDNENESPVEVDDEAQDEDEEMTDFPPTTAATPVAHPFDISKQMSLSFYASKSSHASPTIYPDHINGFSNHPSRPRPVLATAFPCSTSAVSSPSFGPSHHYQTAHSPTTPRTNPIIHSNSSIRSSTHSSLTSPALLPQAIDMINAERDMEKQEATAALLMLNRDRRASGGGIAPLGLEPLREGGRQKAGGGRGMSVRDLLSS